MDIIKDIDYNDDKNDNENNDNDHNNDNDNNGNNNFKDDNDDYNDGGDDGDNNDNDDDGDSDKLMFLSLEVIIQILQIYCFYLTDFIESYTNFAPPPPQWLTYFNFKSIYAFSD